MKPPREQSKNGVVLASRFAVASVGSSPYDDPMSKVLGLDAKTSSLAAWFGFTSGSTFLLVGLMVLTSVVAWMHTRARLAAAAAEEIEVLKEDSPPPPPPKVEQEVKPEPAAPPPTHRVHEAPPPAPAQ